MTAWVAAVIVFPITDCGISHWADSERHPSLAKKEVSMNHFVTLGFVFLLASLALAVVLDADLALRAIDRLVQSEVYTDTQNLMTLTDVPIRF
jgi:hypothetical protein